MVQIEKAVVEVSALLKAVWWMVLEVVLEALEIMRSIFLI